MSIASFPEPTRILTNGVELEVFSAGKGRPIVLCHGWPEIAYSWRHQVPVLVEAGYHVIAPNQRGYGTSSSPENVVDYDITNLTGDMVGILDHFDYDDALFIGHDWGAIVVWNLAMIHRNRVAGLINLSVPFMQRGESEWVGFWEQMLGGDFYIVHFNRQPGVADAAFEANAERFLRNMYRTEQWEGTPPQLEPGMPLIALAHLDEPSGRAFMSEAELEVFVSSFRESGFTGGLNWYRNFSRNWELIGDYEQRVEQPALMIYGRYDVVPASPTLEESVPRVEVVTLPCGHWIQQELPEETNAAMLAWLAREYPA